MLNCLILESMVFKSAFEGLSQFADEIQIQADSEGLSVHALDKSHIVFTELELKPHFFNEYECTEPLKLNVDLEEFQKVLKRIGAADNICLEATKDGSELTVKAYGRVTGEDIQRTFYIQLTDLEYEQPQPPALDYPNQFQINLKSFKRTVEDVALFSHTIILDYDSKNECLTSCGEGDFGRSKVRQRTFYNGIDPEPGKVIVTVEKLQSILKADKFSPEIYLQVGNDVPLSLELHHSIDELTDENGITEMHHEIVGRLKFLVAPRIESEEE